MENIDTEELQPGINKNSSGFGDYIPNSYEDFLSNYYTLTKRYKIRFINENELVKVNFTLFQILFSELTITENNLKKSPEIDGNSYIELLKKVQEVKYAMKKLWHSLKDSTVLGSYYNRTNPGGVHTSL